ncbi:hypothetical protein BRADI_1g20090v3 [Brachypodium distachyon]|uniref:MADS-box domain-containing protein n=1 Tax=Brachypodium distachyon TaxID=15368 RepID=A0A0Q3GWY8_BRADI|nr:hypothetical protein BRADI_1g20090v3 [Brachypodium distachyon]
MAPRRMPSMCRRKIAIKRIESEEDRQVCFSKRQIGLFKKVTELSVLCGMQVAVVVFSPAGNALSLGHPSVDSVVDRLLATFTANTKAAPGGSGAGFGVGSVPLSVAAAMEAMAATVRMELGTKGEKTLLELNKVYGELRAMMEKEKLRKERAEEEIKKQLAEGRSPAAAWLDADLATLSESDLVEFQAALMEMKDVVQLHPDEVLREARTAATTRIMMQLDLMGQLPPPPPGMGHLPPPPLGMGQLPPPPRMGFPETMDLPPPDFGPGGGFFSPPPC